jgi:hypothetical protein
MNEIPLMTDPLGRYWDQPPRDAIALDDTHALMTERAFEQLPEYSRTTPSGVYPGKMWRHCTKDGDWYLCWFGIVDGNPKVCSNNARRILRVDP